MNRNLLKQKTFMAILAVGAFTLGSCADNDYDFDQIDYTVGLGNGELSIPVSSTDTIKLEDVLDLDNSDCVVVRENGDYVFEQVGDDIAPVKVNIAKIVVEQKNSMSYPFDLDLSSLSAAKPGNVKRISVDVPSQTAEIHVFNYEGESEEVVDLNMVGVEQTPVSLIVRFPADMKNYIPSIKALKLALPEYIAFENVSSGAAFSQEGNSFVFSNVSTAKDLRLDMNLIGLDFKAQDTGLGGANVKDGKISIDGSVKMTIDVGRVEINGVTPPTAPFKIENDLVLGADLTVVAAEGKFNPSINMENLGKVEITGVPDFLKDGNVVADLDNPQIILSVESNAEVSGIIDGTITSTKTGNAPKTISVEGIKIHPNTRTEVCICRRSTTDIEAAFGSENVYVVPNITDLIKTIPDKIEFDAVTKADPTKVCRFRFGYDYEIKPAYRVEAPIAFGKDANIVYKDSLLEWNEDVKDLDLTEGAYVELKANIENRAPIFLNLDAYAVDVNGNDMSGDLDVEVSNSIIASSDGKSSKVTPITITVRQKRQGALKKIDGLQFVVQGRAKSDDGKESVVGVTLNSRKHFLIAKDVRVKIVGKVIADLN